MNNEIELRLVKHEDVLGVFDIFSDSKVCEYYDIEPFSVVEQAGVQVERWMKLADEKKQFRYGIIVNERVIGTCGIYSIYWHQKRASVGYDLKSEIWGKGIMKSALEKLIDISKNEYNLNRIQALVLQANLRSKAVLAKIGFQYEGLLREYEYWEGKGFVDLEMHSLLLN